MAPTPTEPNSPPDLAGVWPKLPEELADASNAVNATKDEELLPTWDAPDASSSIPVAMPVPEEALDLTAIPEAIPVASLASPAVAEPEPELVPVAEVLPVEEAPLAETPEFCPSCQSPRAGESQFCYDCGFMFLPKEEPQRGVAQAEMPEKKRLAGRYEIWEALAAKGSLNRYRAWDCGVAGLTTPVILVQMPCDAGIDSEQRVDSEPNTMAAVTEDLVSLAEPAADEQPATVPDDSEIGLPGQWPHLGWEWQTLAKADHASLPRVLDQFQEEDHFWLVEEVPEGRSLWDTWDDPAHSYTKRFEWLAEIAEALQALHNAGAIVEGLRPDMVVITPQGHAALVDLSDLLPLPLPAEPHLRATPYTAPELILAPESVDARADLYGFGAMVYSLYLGRELTEMDFERQGVPKPFVLQFPDVHPALARLVMKTFTREVSQRFPSDEAAKEDPSGFLELARVLRAIGPVLDQVRLDIGGWTTTGMVRTGNEDAFALIQSVSGRQDHVGERALVILADGMGGYEAGEVASSMAIDTLRQILLKETWFTGLTEDCSKPSVPFDVQACKDALVEALNEANRQVYTASRTPGQGRRGMGCTVEVVYVDGQRVVVAHVGDSRTYHYTDGRLVQLTRDQTLVNRLVELGQLTPEEAESHPRKNELQQAVGGQPVVDVLAYDAPLKPGDWIIVCSDGLTGHVDPATLTEMIQRADSAEMCARRLCNLANLYGGTDNCTVVAIRAT